MELAHPTVRKSNDAIRAKIAELMPEYDALRRGLDYPDAQTREAAYFVTEQFRGVVEAFEWILGLRASPVYRHLVVTDEALGNELTAVSRHVLDDLPPPEGMHQQYALGVYRALDWVRHNPGADRYIANPAELG